MVQMVEQSVAPGPLAAVSPLPPGPSRAKLQRLVEPFARADSRLGYSAFLIDLAIYAASIITVLLAHAAWIKVAAGILAGLGLVNLGSLAHEAAHKALVRSRSGNKLIAVISMTLGLFNYRLWIFDHHVLHHVQTNVQGANSFSPLSPEQYEALSPLRRALYRAFRSTSGAGVFLYYVLERWPEVHLYPGSWLPKQYHASAWRYTALQASYGLGLLALLAAVAAVRHESIALTLVCGFVVPYAVWFTVFSMTVCLQHTHPRVRWYRNRAELDQAPETVSVHVVVPAWLNHLTHYALEHPVHHLTAKVPHYHLRRAQAALASAVQPAVVVMQFTGANMCDVFRRCKLYDYDRHVWLDFDGNVTSVPEGPPPSANQRSAGAGLLPDRPDHGAGIFFPEPDVSD
jgi:omega-6 fatty acid desaturase (delta-12 desaturase)